QQQKEQPGKQTHMYPEPETIREGYVGSRRLADKACIITGGDSGIGRAVAVHFAAESARIVGIVYLEEGEDAEKTRELVERRGARCVTIRGDVKDPEFPRAAIDRFVGESGGALDVLVNNAAEQWPQKDIEDITYEQLDSTFRTNIYSQFLFVQAALPHMKEGASIINTTSITAYRGSGHLLDYSATKGAIVAFTRSLSTALVKRGVRVNGVAPGPIWTPLIPATFPPDKVESFGRNTPMGRAGQPSEVAPAYVFLGSADASYMTGQVLHPNGGDFISS
ncbi:MAG TPA: SDR family oxidoreductase, partial [Gammaproteobacteria bacterium]|nr:SDR family oxidoreductase [Gammaproteobacteria bacterium]